MFWEFHPCSTRGSRDETNGTGVSANSGVITCKLPEYWELLTFTYTQEVFPDAGFEPTRKISESPEAAALGVWENAYVL